MGKKIVHGLLGADLIGFHTSEYLQHFLKTMSMVTGLDHRYREIFNRKGIVKADLFPIGIDFDKFYNTADNPTVLTHRQAIAERFGSNKIIFSVDRLDYTKGVTHRLSGYARLLELYPEWRGKVVFILVVVPSRQIVSKYNERRKMIEEQVSRINESIPHSNGSPSCTLQPGSLRRIVRPVSVGGYRSHHLASRWYESGGQRICCQPDRGRWCPDTSELAGAANELGEAMQVNPTWINPDTCELAGAANELAKRCKSTPPISRQSEITTSHGR